MAKDAFYVQFRCVWLKAMNVKAFKLKIQGRLISMNLFCKSVSNIVFFISVCFRVSRFGLVSETLYGKLCKLSNVDVFYLQKTKLVFCRLLSATATAFFASIAVNIRLSFS